MRTSLWCNLPTWCLILAMSRVTDRMLRVTDRHECTDARVDTLTIWKTNRLTKLDLLEQTVLFTLSGWVRLHHGSHTYAICAWLQLNKLQRQHTSTGWHEKIHVHLGVRTSTRDPEDPMRKDPEDPSETGRFRKIQVKESHDCYRTITAGTNTYTTA